MRRRKRHRLKINHTHYKINLTTTMTSSTIRLVYPQWQGGVVTSYVTELPPEEAARGYHLGAHLLNFLAPNNGQETLVVPISTALKERVKQDGVMDRDDIVDQTRAALEMLRVAKPDRIVTLGGECAVSVVPFTYLAERYDSDVAMIWIDAHPDITLPGDVYPGYHAMAVTACMGKGDEKIISLLPRTIDASRILLLGIRNWERDEIEVRKDDLKLKHISAEEIANDSEAVKLWLRGTRASKVMVHFDMDVLDPAEIIAAVGTDPNGMKIEQVVRVIKDIAAEKELVALTVAEHMPRVAIKLKKMLSQLPLLN
eukprot:Blabericola_migrator_1__8570@NODE_4483_length_1132_cov_443_726761_g1345_i4_p1_GENE_NODE_4483_length_1132_cov_443_726761_g1345_i4NODE_4483_length_1132_cov_443_726761_g1345_i4_p1_ORF_typecomplete_len313_score48_78Arginase/PF00491_21/6_1e37GP57/PF17594_2/0_18_NODE_4483_length_1132_cov_443_726761_g1345_i4771015